MREAIGGTWSMQLVIAFMLFFVGFLALSLNYSKAFQIKNEMLTMIEKREGVTTGANGSIALLNKYLINRGYGVQNTCPNGSYGVADLNNNVIERVTNTNKKYYYCVQKVKSPSSNNQSKVYYEINIFFYFNLPVIGDIFKFTINGTTNDITIPADNLTAITK